MDRKSDYFRSIIIAIAIIVAASIIGGAIDRAGLNIANQVSNIANQLRWLVEAG